MNNSTIIKPVVVCVPTWEYPNNRFEVEIIRELQHGFMEVKRKSDGKVVQYHRSNLVFSLVEGS